MKPESHLEPIDWEELIWICYWDLDYPVHNLDELLRLEDLRGEMLERCQQRDSRSD